MENRLLRQQNRNAVALIPGRFRWWWKLPAGAREIVASVDAPAHPVPCPRRQTAGRPLLSRDDRGKSGLHGNTVPANGRRGRPQGQCHRKQTARRVATQGGQPGYAHSRTQVTRSSTTWSSSPMHYKTSSPSPVKGDEWITKMRLRMRWVDNHEEQRRPMHMDARSQPSSCWRQGLGGGRLQVHPRQR